MDEKWCGDLESLVSSMGVPAAHLTQVFASFPTLYEKLRVENIALKAKLSELDRKYKEQLELNVKELQPLKEKISAQETKISAQETEIERLTKENDDLRKIYEDFVRPVALRQVGLCVREKLLREVFDSDIEMAWKELKIRDLEEMEQWFLKDSKLVKYQKKWEVLQKKYRLPDTYFLSKSIYRVGAEGIVNAHGKDLNLDVQKLREMAVNQFDEPLLSDMLQLIEIDSELSKDRNEDLLRYK